MARSPSPRQRPVVACSRGVQCFCMAQLKESLPSSLEPFNKVAIALKRPHLFYANLFFEISHLHVVHSVTLTPLSSLFFSSSVHPMFMS